LGFLSVCFKTPRSAGRNLTHSFESKEEYTACINKPDKPFRLCS